MPKDYLNGCYSTFPVVGISDGLTIRQYFAGLAMQGLLANDWKGYKTNDEDCSLLSQVAVNYADALIAELNKTI